MYAGFQGYSGYTRIYKTGTNCNSPAFAATSSEPVTLYPSGNIRFFTTMVNSGTPCFEAEYTLGSNAEIKSKRLINAYDSGLSEASEHVGDQFRRSNHGSGYGVLYFDPASADTGSYLACGQMCQICGAGSRTSYSGGGYNEMWGESIRLITLAPMPRLLLWLQQVPMSLHTQVQPMSRPISLMMLYRASQPLYGRMDTRRHTDI